MMITYTVYNPDRLGFVLCKIDQTGKIIGGGNDVEWTPTSINAFQYMIDQIIRGIATDKAKDFANRTRCVPDIKHPKEKDVITLGELMGGKQKELFERIIKSGNRYMSKTDWTSDRIKNQVQGLLAHGRSLSHIARHLGVPKSTLSKANKRHNYRLYIPKKKDDIPEKDDDE